MNRRILIRLIVIVLSTLLCVYLFAGFPPGLEEMKKRIRLGLDLRGGTELVLQVVTDDAIRAETNQVIATIQSRLQQDKVLFRSVTPAPETVDEISVIGVEPAKDSDFRDLISTTHVSWDLTPVSEGVPNSYKLKLKPQQVQQYRADSVDQAIITINNRINQYGVAEAYVQKRGGAGEYEILVQFPGVQDPLKVREIIRKTALLELKLVEGTNTYPTREAALQQYGGILPPHLEVLPSKERGVDGSQFYYIVQKTAGVTGRDLKSAYASRDENGRPAVSFNLTVDGAAKFGDLTGRNVGKLLAIILDGTIQSAPRLESKISDSGQITGGSGGFSQEQVQDLVLLLKSGALPARMVYLEEAVLGPSLGADSIRAGVLSAVVALALVTLFVLFYYRGSGINATVAMILNLVILLGAMAYFEATLTLPGIAGVILTIGVGIDSNVLIFERIREELRAGKTPSSAVNTSFQRVFITLVDTHLAALISALFLLLFGTGPVQGFAVTLVIGLISNMFTSVFVSRTLFEMVLARKGREQMISI